MLSIHKIILCGETYGMIPVIIFRTAVQQRVDPNINNNHRRIWKQGSIGSEGAWGVQFGNARTTPIV